MLRKCLGFVIGTEIHRKNLVTRNTRYRFFKNFRWIVRTAQEKSPVSLIPVFCWVRMNSKRKIELKDSVWPLVRKKQGRNPKLSLKVKKANPWISRSSWSLIFNHCCCEWRKESDHPPKQLRWKNPVWKLQQLKTSPTATSQFADERKQGSSFSLFLPLFAQMCSRIRSLGLSLSKILCSLLFSRDSKFARSNEWNSSDPC